MSKIVKEHITFKRGIEPKQAMNIGMTNTIEDWLKKFSVTRYHINSDLTIDVDRDVDFRNPQEHFSKFPDYIQFNKVEGYFSLVNIGLTTLKGCPKYVKRQFCCNMNKLMTLDYCPEEVGMFICNDNPGAFTVDDVKSRCKVNDYIEVVKDQEII